MAMKASEARAATPRFGIELEMFGDPYTAVEMLHDAGFASTGTVGGERLGSCGYLLGDCPNGYEDEESGEWVSGEEAGDCCHCGSCYDCGYSPSDEGLHAYHCSCDSCDYSRTSGLFACQEDCTVDAEFVSRILDVTRKPDMDELARFDDFFPRLVRNSSWHEPGAEAGNHIHVGRPTRWTRTHSGWVNFLFSRFHNEWAYIAGAGDVIRDYNGSAPPEGDVMNGTSPDTLIEYWDETSWLRRRPQTVEYRLWNSPNERGYIPFHVNMSLALSRWATVMADRAPDACVGDVQKIVPKMWKRAFQDVALFMDHRVPGSERHDSRLLDLASQAH